MGTGRLNRIGKWNALRRYNRDKKLRAFMVELFSGINKDPLAIYDVPYLLGLLPTPLRNIIHNTGISQRLLETQSGLLMVPTSLKKAIAKDRAIDLIERFI